MKTKYYRCRGFRPIPMDQVEDIKEAAKVFANRLARRICGGRGFCNNIKANSWSPNYTNVEYQAFVGVPDGNGCSGQNVWLTVYSD